ncbi:MAG: ankyrin repeat domain-containing protein [Verrucomicrobiae bacterium]|nr:ankyrin repeat domain-containing protein [Verrucomicrobiae bacterium]
MATHATVSRGLPQRPRIEVPKREARELLRQFRNASPDALDRIRRRHPKFHDADNATLCAATFRLSDAQCVIAREYGFSHWTALKQRIEGNPAAVRLLKAISAGDRDSTVRILRANPQLLHVPLRSGNWGPPMSHAANLGRLDMVQAIAPIGARDVQHAFDRAILQGHLDCARWLHQHGAQLAPGIVMGACETLNAEGFRFLDELNAPFTNEKGDPLAPLALVVETYGRHAEGKHRILERFARRGYAFPDTPIVAFHRGDLRRLEQFLRRDPSLIHRHFAYREIYPGELGCADDGRSGMHWTPLDGTTLLHIAIDFNDPAAFELLLRLGADVNACARVDAEGFGGHTPLFNAVVCGPGRDTSMTQTLLARGADPNRRASLRKFLDWCEEPRWHEARDVTPRDWARSFPDPMWVHHEALRLLDDGASNGR